MEQQVTRVSTSMEYRYAIHSKPKLVQYHVLVKQGLTKHSYATVRKYLQSSKTSWVIYSKDWLDYL